MKRNRFTVRINRRTAEAVSHLIVQPASGGIEYLFGPNGSADVWLRRMDGSGGLFIEASHGPYGLGIRLHPFAGSPSLSVPRNDESKPGFYETRDLEVCMYDESMIAHEHRSWYFETGRK